MYNVVLNAVHASYIASIVVSSVTVYKDLKSPETMFLGLHKLSCSSIEAHHHSY